MAVKESQKEDVSKMKNFVKVIKIVAALCLIIFGMIGLLLEAGNYSQQGSYDHFGLLLAVLILTAGVLLIGGKHLISFLRRAGFGWLTFLLFTAIIELLAGISLTVFIIILALQGFISGEMGTMVGILSLASLLFLLPLIIFKAAMVYGLFARKKWALYLTLAFAILYSLGGLAGFFAVPLIALILLFYAALLLLAAVRCLQHSAYFNTI